MSSRTSVRVAPVSVYTRLASQARATRRQAARDLVQASARSAVEIMEQRVMLTGTPVLGVNFATTRTIGTDVTLASTDTAGLVPMANWNNAISANQGPTTGTLTGLNDASGAATTSGVSWQSNGTWDNKGTAPNNFTGADNKLMNGYIWYNGAPGDTAAADKVATTASLTSNTLDGNGVLFTGLTGATYDVVVYSLSDGGGQGGVTTVTGSNSSATGVNDGPSSSYVLGKNYMLFLNMHPQNGDLLITPDGTTFRNNYNAIELLNPSTAAPAAPTGLTATQGASGAANLSWTAASPQGDEYLVQRSNTATGPWTTLATLDKSVTTYTDLTPPTGQSFYQVVAVNSAGQAASTAAGPITVVASTSAPILGIHFGADYTTDITTGNALAPTDTAGVVPMSHWNNETGGSAAPTSATGLTDATGATTGVGVSWETNNVWGSGGNDHFAPPDNLLMDGYLDNHGGTAAATSAALTSGTLNGNGVLLTGLTGTSYDVIVYSLGDAAGRSGQISVTGANSEALGNQTQSSTTYVRGQNYAEFFGMHPLGGSLLITPRSTDTRNPINGIELVTATSTAAPAAPTNLTAALNAAHTAAVLNWTENGTAAQQYFVERATNAGFTTGVTTLAVLNPSSGTTGTFTDNGMTAGVQYWYRIGAFNDFSGGTEVDSNIAGPVFVPVSNSNNPIGINFATGDGNTFSLNPTDVAGAYPIANWNNELTNAGTASLVVDNSGAGTSLGVQWQADTSWDATVENATDGFTGADHTLMAGYLDDFGLPPSSTGAARATNAALTSGTLDGVGTLVTGLNQSAYDVVVYAMSAVFNRGYSITVTGATSSTQFTPGVPSVQTQYVLGTNTLVFPDVAPSGHNLLILPDNTSVRDDMQGFELLPIATSAPTAVTLAGTYDPANAAADLSWTGGGTNTLLYQVQRSTSASGPWTTVSQSLPSATTAVDNLPLVGQGYFYRLLSTNSFNGGSTAASNVVGPFSAPAGSGGEAHYFPQAFWGGQPTVTQFVTTVNENFANGSPDPSIPNSNNSMVFTGKIKANEAGIYTFVSNSDDDGYLYVDGVLVSSDPGGHGPRNPAATLLTPISLAANSTNDFVFLVNQGGGGAAAHLLWVTPSMAAANPTATPVTVPNTNLTSAVGTPSQPTGLAVSGTPGTNTVDFTFTSDNNAVVHYQLQRSTDGTNWVTVSQTNPSGAFAVGSPDTAIPIEDATANPSTTYQYRVVGMNFDHTGTPSAPVTVTTAAATQGPGVELRYYNGQIASQTDNLDPHNFAINGLPTEFQSFDFQSADQNFNGSPDAALYHNLPRVNPYGFASVWTGQVVTDGAGMYTFVTNTSDDGYLFVNGVLVSSDPGVHAQRDATTLTPLSLAANTAYNFVFIQQEVNNGLSATNPAGAHLSWIEPGSASAVPIPAATGSGGGLEKLMSTPDKQTIDASGHITETAGQSAAGTLTATPAGSGITLSWTDQSLSELWFEVQRATSATGPFTTIGNAGLDGTSFTDSNVVAGTHYFYRVRGANFDATGPFSNTADAVAPAPSQTVVGTAGNDTITIKKDATDPTKDDVWVNVPTTGPFTQQVSNGQTIVISGAGVATGGTDTLVIDSSNGNPIPSATGTDLRLDSGTGNFTLSGSLPTLDATHIVDLAKSTLNIPYTGTSPLASIQGALKSGFLKSTEAGASSGKFAIADVDAAGKVTLSYRVVGDLNGDGTVAFADLLALAQHYNQTGVDWSKGDLNYDGTVGFADLLALAQHYNQTAASAPAAAAASPTLASQTLDSLLTGKKARKH